MNYNKKQAIETASNANKQKKNTQNKKTSKQKQPRKQTNKTRNKQTRRPRNQTKTNKQAKQPRTQKTSKQNKKQASSTEMPAACIAMYNPPTQIFIHSRASYSLPPQSFIYLTFLHYSVICAL